MHDFCWLCSVIKLKLMKKLILLLLVSLAAVLTSHAQSFTLSYSNGQLPHDTIIEFFATPDQTVVEAHVYITNNSDQEKKVLVKKEELEVLEGTFNTFCFSGICYPPDVFLSPEALLLEPGQTSSDQDFYADYIPMGIQGSSLIRYTFFEERDATDSISVIIKFTIGNVGTGHHLAASLSEISKPYPNPASSVVSFNINLHSTATDARLIIRNLVGSVVLTHSISERNGKITIPVSGLKEGMYFYTLLVQGDHAVQTGRLIVKR